MAFKEAFIPEFEREMATTRKVIERIPDDKLGFRPHPKSWTAAELVTHIVQIPTWGQTTMATDEFDFAPGGKQYESPAAFTETKSALAEFDKNVAACLAAMDRDDAYYLGEWKMLKNGVPVLAAPRTALMRSFVTNHLIHHRGQLTVYLRLTGVPVPEIYGPTADEGKFF